MLISETSAYANISVITESNMARKSQPQWTSNKQTDPSMTWPGITHEAEQSLEINYTSTKSIYYIDN
mgnify:CR=1 FL=1